MAWAVERTVQGPSGDTRDRNAEPRPAPLQPGVGAGVDLDYYLETRVPDNWIPLVPVAVGVGVVALKKGAMLNPETNKPVLARGVILRPTPLVIRDEESRAKASGSAASRRLPETLTEVTSGGSVGASASVAGKGARALASIGRYRGRQANEQTSLRSISNCTTE